MNWKKTSLVFLGIIYMTLSIAQQTPRVFVFTDINIDSGDPDDRQSLIHLLWYANELNIEGVVPDRWNAEGYEACMQVVNAYQKDFETYNFEQLGYPKPDSLRNLIAKDTANAINKFRDAAMRSDSPLYVLIWGNMLVLKKALLSYPELADNIRLISIGTGVMLEEHIRHMPDDWEKTDKPCTQYNWNGFGRNDIYNDPRFDDMWWLEINWIYSGMFTGDEPKEIFHKLLKYGHMGKHMGEVVKNEPWAQYFRVGDTPSVLYLITPGHDFNNPQEASWAGKFFKPFPDTRPNYYTDFSDSIVWDYKNPCNTWDNHQKVNEVAKKTLVVQRDDMYQSMLNKLNELYK